jgi:hypothetical protein
MTSEELIQSGNSFILRTSLVFLLVQLLILPQLPPNQKETNQIIGVEVSRLKQRRRGLETKLRDIELGLRALQTRSGIGYIVQSDDVQPNALVKERQTLLQQGLKLSRQEKELSDNLAANAQQLVTLEKSKYSREIKIPATDVVLDEAKVRTYYASALVLSLIVLLFFHRLPLLKSIGGKNDPLPPFWAAPLAYGKYGLDFWACTIRNLLGLGLVLLVFELFLESSKKFPEFFVSAALYIFNWSVGIVTAIFYGVLLLRSIVSSTWGISPLKGR